MNSKFMLSPDGEHIVEVLTSGGPYPSVSIWVNDYHANSSGRMIKFTADILLSGWIELEE